MAGDNIFTQVIDAVKGVSKPNNLQHGPPAPQGELAIEMEKIYSTNESSVLTNWYRQRPFAFVFTNSKGLRNTFYLPIAPSNINIVTHFATNVISTMYGTVEEHSEQRYYDITISGTTGASPRYWDTVEEQLKLLNPVIGRAGLAVNAGFGDIAGGFFKRTQALLENTLNQVSEVFGEDPVKTGIDLKRTGYVAFHNFYKFLLAYKKDTSSAGIRKSVGKEGSAHPLRFVNYKDNNQYDVSIQQFQLTRDVSEPFLYNYNITMRAYNLRIADAQEIEADVKSREAELGLDGVKTSFLAKMSNKAAAAKRAAYSAVGAAKGFGK